MKLTLITSGIVAGILVFATLLSWILGYPALRWFFPSALIALALFLGTATWRNIAEERQFREFIWSKKADRELQELIEQEKLSYKDETGRAKVRGAYTTRKIGNEWTGNNLHGAVPRRKDKRQFLKRRP